MTRLLLVIALVWIALETYFGGRPSDATMVAASLGSAYVAGLALVLKIGAREQRRR